MQNRYEQFSFTVSALNRSISRIEAEEMSKYGLKGIYAQYLSPLSRHPNGLTAARLCEICAKDKAAVSRAIAEMEQKGLIERETRGESGYRAKLILTEKGKAAAEYVRKRAQTIVEQAGQDLTEENRKIFYESLAKIAEQLRKIEK